MKNKQKNTIQHQHKINTERIQIEKKNWRTEDHYFSPKSYVVPTEKLSVP